MSSSDTTSSNHTAILHELDFSTDHFQRVKDLPNRPSPPSTSILDKVAAGTLPTKDSNIDIFSSLAKYNSNILDNPILSDLQTQSEGEWQKLQRGVVGSVDDPAAVAKFNAQVAQVQAFDQYIHFAGQFLHQQGLAHPANDVLETDLWSEEQLCRQVKRDWIRYYHVQKSKHAVYNAGLQRKMDDGKHRNDKTEVQKLKKERMVFESDVLRKFQRKLVRQMMRARLMRMIEDAVEEVEKSYYLFLLLKMEEKEPRRPLIQLLHDYERAQGKLVAEMDELLSILNINIEFVESFRMGPTGTEKLARKANTRMRRLCAKDVDDLEEREPAAKKRFTADGHGYFRAFDEINEVKNEEGIAILIWEQVEDLMRKLEMEVLRSDVVVFAQMALLRVMVDAGKESG